MKFREMMEKRECHNYACFKTAYLIYGIKIGDVKDTAMEDKEALRQKCLEHGIELCCDMRQNGFDVVVDTLSGWINFRNETDMEELRADGEKRYLTFEYVEEDCNE